MLTERRGSCGNGWIVSCAIETYQRARLLILRLRRFQILIGDIYLLFQSVQLRVLKNVPPFAARDLIIGLCGFPGGRNFFVLRRRWSRRFRVPWPNCAAAENKYNDSQTADFGPQIPV